jgi:hypothetical protein
MNTLNSVILHDHLRGAYLVPDDRDGVDGLVNVYKSGIFSKLFTKFSFNITPSVSAIRQEHLNGIKSSIPQFIGIRVLTCEKEVIVVYYFSNTVFQPWCQ